MSKGLSTATLCMKGTGARTFQYFVFLFFLSATLLNSAPSSYLVIASSSFASSSVASSSCATVTTTVPVITSADPVLRVSWRATEDVSTIARCIFEVGTYAGGGDVVAPTLLGASDRSYVVTCLTAGLVSGGGAMLPGLRQVAR